jgi:arabinan endo-1,5-alpha-L-arabinosidase
MKLKRIIPAAVSGMMLMSLFPGTMAGAARSRVSVHDPSVVKDPATGTYYAFGSHIDAAKSTDLQNWKLFTNGYKTPGNVEFGDLSGNLKKAFAWCGEDLEDCKGGFAVWAPDVVWNPEFRNSDGTTGAYMMYFCTSSTYIRSVICFATSKTIEGPYTFGDTLIYSGFTENDSYAKSNTKNVNRKYTSTNVDELIAAGQVSFNQNWFNKSNFNNQLFPNAIDPTIYYDTNGKMYMCYGSWSGGIFTLEIDPKTGKCIHPKSGQTSDGRMIDSYFGTKISGGYGKSGEGPFIEYNPETGFYYLWVTYGGLTATGGYNMRVFRSTSPTGPFFDPSGKNAVLASSTNLDTVGLKVMGNHKFKTNDQAYMAPGHNSVLRDDDGKWYLVNHTRFNGGTEYHEVRVHSMQFNAEGWPVVAPNEYSGDAIDNGGYSASDIAGTYEFINHGTDTGSKIYESVNITLTEDGKITGALTGTWSEAKDSNDAVIIAGGRLYSGKFLAAKDEKGKKVMSFTAVGNDNKTIWGNKTTEFTGTPRAYTKKEFIAEDPALMDASVSYVLTNRNSGFVADIINGVMENGSNIRQWENNGEKCQHWILRKSSEHQGYYYIISESDIKFALRCAGKEDGENIELASFNAEDTSQLFKFSRNENGTYMISTFASGGTKFMEVAGASAEYGANIAQWGPTNNFCQQWILTAAGELPAEYTPPVETTPPAVTTPPAETTAPAVTTPPVEYTPADLNDDGKVNIADLILLKSILNGASADAREQLAADVNSDEVVNASDLTAIISILMGKD